VGKVAYSFSDTDAFQSSETWLGLGANSFGRWPDEYLVQSISEESAAKLVAKAAVPAK